MTRPLIAGAYPLSTGSRALNKGILYALYKRANPVVSKEDIDLESNDSAKTYHRMWRSICKMSDNTILREVEAMQFLSKN